MATQGGPPAAAAAPDRPRPDVLAYPSPTTSRYLVFLVALVSAGMFVGIWAHNQILWDEWFAVVTRCEQEALRQAPTRPGLPDSLTREGVAAPCRADADRRRAAFAFGGAAAAGAAGLIVLYLVPGVVERRRRLRPPVPELQAASDRLAALAAEAGLSHPPGLVLGSATQRDGFSYGSPGRYRIALPQAVAVRWRSASLFEPLVRHELAHVAHGDVALAWLVRSVWYALAPLLAVPLLLTLVSRDRSLLGDYAWRAALLAVVVQLVSSQLLRSREHDADLLAARWMGGPEAVAALLARVRPPGQQSWYRRLLANHPSPARRLAVLERPELAAGMTFLDGFTPALLATLAVPLIVSGLVTLLMGAGRSDLAQAAAAVVAGPLLGGSVGLGLWRATLVQRVAGGVVRPGSVAFGVAAGLVLGQLASLAQTGTGFLGDVSHPWLLVVVALAGLGATVLVASLGELWADAAAAVRHPRTSWAAALVVGSVAYAIMLWVAGWLQLLLDWGGWPLTGLWLVTVLGSWPTIGAGAVLVGAAAWALAASRRGAAAPTWLLEPGRSHPWPAAGRTGLIEAVLVAVAVGLTGAGTLIAFRVLAGPAPADATEQRFYTYVWMVATAGAAATLALAVLVPRRGVGAGALAGPLACLVTVAGFLAMNTALGGKLYAGFVISVARPPLALGLVLAVLVAPAGLLAWHRKRPVATLWPAAAAIGLVAVLAVAAGQDTLTGFQPVAAPPAAGERERLVALAEATKYAATADDVIRRYQAVEGAVAGIDADRSADGPTRATRVRNDVLVPLRTLLRDVEAYQPPSPTIESLHRTCLAFLRSSVDAFEAYAAAFEAENPVSLAEAQAKAQQGRLLYASWQAGLQKLVATADPSGTGSTSRTGTGPGATPGDPSAPTPTSTAPAPPATELASTAHAEASATAPDSVDDAGNPVGYDAGNVLDDDPSTAWRVKGSGRRVVLGLRLQAPAHITQVGLIPGYAKADPTTGKDRFSENRRIREVRWHFSDGTILPQQFRDEPTMQRIPVDVTADWVLIEIRATVAGDSDHDYTPISDVSILGTT
jgi:Zn-dependent protease with chaperone function